MGVQEAARGLKVVWVAKEPNQKLKLCPSLTQGLRQCYNSLLDE